MSLVALFPQKSTPFYLKRAVARLKKKRGVMWIPGPLPLDSIPPHYTQQVQGQHSIDR